MTIQIAAAPRIRMTPMERAAGRLMRAPDHGAGDDAAAAAAAAADALAATAAADALAAEVAAEEAAAAAALVASGGDTAAAKAATAKAAKLAKDLAALQARLKTFEGIDPVAARENAKKVSAAETATKEAEKAKAIAEGNFEKLRELQNDEHTTALESIRAERDAMRAEKDAALKEAAAGKVEAAFAGSKFVADETILTGGKANRLFGDHVEVEDGKVVVYDKPANDAGRTKIMDARGNPLSFNDAITKVINADPDKDSLIKSKVTPGSGTKTAEGKPPQTPMDRQAKLAAGLRALRGL